MCIVDLSAANENGLALILLRVPVKDLIKKCTQVSEQWNRILSDNDFWRKKMEQDGYKLDWPKLAGLSIRAFKWMTVKHPFERNFLKDNWNLESQTGKKLTLDPRWDADWQGGSDIDYNGSPARVEIPPKFGCEPEIPEGYEKPIQACIAIRDKMFEKKIVIKLADEGLTDEIMDNYRPTIVVSEMVGNRRDCAGFYAMRCCLDVSNKYYRQYVPNGDKSECRDEYGRWVGVTIIKRFEKGQVDEGWHRVEHEFKDYPAGMRYLILKCTAFGKGPNPQGHYAIKLANCSVKALCEKNAK